MVADGVLKERQRLLAIDIFSPSAPLALAFVDLRPLSEADIARGQEIAQLTSA